MAGMEVMVGIRAAREALELARSGLSVLTQETAVAVVMAAVLVVLATGEMVALRH